MAASPPKNTRNVRNTKNSKNTKSSRPQEKNRNKEKVARAPKNSFLQIHIGLAKASFIELWHRPMGNLLTLLVITMSLAMPASLYLLTKNVAFVANHIATPSQISIYFEPDTPEARVMVIKDGLETNPQVSEVEFISSQQGLDELSQDAGFADAISLLEPFALPSVLLVKPTDQDKQQIKILADEIRAESNVTDVRLDEDWLTRLDAIKKLIGLVVISLSSFMLLSVFLIVGNTLRFNVLEHKDEIQTMKLIGATDGFILRPYLYAGMWLGLIGAAAAWLVTALLTLLLNDAVSHLAQLYDSHFQLLGLGWDETLILLMVGAFVGCVAARLSARRHLKEIEPI